MPRKARDVMKALSKKGFQEDDGRDHHYYFFYVNGKKTIIKTKVSRGASHSDVPDVILNRMQKQLHLPKKEFNEYLNCTFSENDYKNYLASQGIVKIEKEKIPS